MWCVCRGSGTDFGKLDFDDLQYKTRKPYNGFKQHFQTVIANDCMVLEGAKR